MYFLPRRRKLNLKDWQNLKAQLPFTGGFDGEVMGEYGNKGEIFGHGDFYFDRAQSG